MTPITAIPASITSVLRNSRADADERKKDIFRQARASHGKTDGNAANRGDAETRRQAKQRIEHVVRQDARCTQANEGGRYVFEGWKQARRKDARTRGQFP